MRSRVRSAALAAAFLCAASSVQASAVDALRSFLAQTKTARGDFTQQVTRGTAQAAPPSSGTFAFERPGKFRWIYQKPYEQVLVADGEKLYLYDKDLNQVTVKKISAALPASPASILFGTSDFEREFTVKDDGKRDGLAWLVAVPRGKDSPFEQIEIGFADTVPAVMVIKDSFGQTSRLVFRSFERNPRVEPESFRFVPPKGVDILEDR